MSGFVADVQQKTLEIVLYAVIAIMHNFSTLRMNIGIQSMSWNDETM